MADEPQLGLATTYQLLKELRARIAMDYYQGGGGLQYSTVRGRPPEQDAIKAGADAVLVETCCEVMHDAYEAAASKEGWETQKASRKPWSDVPEANKATMRHAVRALLIHIEEAGQQPAGETDG